MPLDSRSISDENRETVFGVLEIPFIYGVCQAPSTIVWRLKLRNRSAMYKETLRFEYENKSGFRRNDESNDGIHKKTK